MNKFSKPHNWYTQVHPTLKFESMGIFRATIHTMSMKMTGWRRCVWTQGLQGFGSEALHGQKGNLSANWRKSQGSTLQSQTSYSLAAPHPWGTLPPTRPWHCHPANVWGEEVAATNTSCSGFHVKGGPANKATTFGYSLKGWSKRQKATP